MPTTLKEFEAVFPSLVEDLSQHVKQYGLPEDALKWYQDVSISMVPYGWVYPISSLNKQDSMMLKFP